MRRSRIMLAALSACALMPSANAGEIIDTNLPAGDVIIAVDGRADGAAAFSGDQGLWYQPFNVNHSLLEYTFQPGTYTFRVINSTDAAAMFPGLTAAQLAQVGVGAWTYNSPWVTDILAFDSSAATDPSEAQLFNIATRSGYYTSAGQAYSAAITEGRYDQLVLGNRVSGPVQYSYTFSQATTLIFAVPDYYLPDNGGVESVLVSSASVPEPSSLVLAALGLGTIATGVLVSRRGAGRPASRG